MGKRKSKSQLEKERREDEADQIADQEFAEEIRIKAKSAIDMVKTAGASATLAMMQKRRFYHNWAERIHGVDMPKCWDAFKNLRRTAAERFEADIYETTEDDHLSVLERSALTTQEDQDFMDEGMPD